MKYQPKVNQTQQYSDSQGVHKGKLILLLQDKSKEKKFPCISSNINGEDWRIMDNLVRSPRHYYNPIIISETEEIEVGDWYLDDANQIRQSIIDDKKYWSNRSDYNKIIVLPEHFSDKHLQAIVDGKMKGGGEVLVKCYTDNTKWGSGPIKKIHLNKQTHITLFPAKPSLEEAFEEWYRKNYPKTHDSEDKTTVIGKQLMKNIWMDCAKWVKENNY